MKQDGDYSLGLEMKTLLCSRFQALPTTWSNHAAQSTRTKAPSMHALLSHFHAIPSLPVHVKHTYPIKDRT